MMRMFDVQGFILVGGASSRMGSDKSQLKFGTVTAVELIAEALYSVSSAVSTVGWPEQRLARLPNILDLRPGCGPLAGLEAALKHSDSTCCMVVACDFPFVTGTLFRRLLESISDSDAVVPLQSDGHPQPLCAVYRVSTCLPAAASAIAANQHSPRALLNRVRTRFVPFPELSQLDQSEYFFFNVNTPANYRRATQVFDQIQARDAPAANESSGDPAKLL